MNINFTKLRAIFSVYCNAEKESKYKLIKLIDTYTGKSTYNKYKKNI